MHREDGEGDQGCDIGTPTLPPPPPHLYGITEAKDLRVNPRFPVRDGPLRVVGARAVCHLLNACHDLVARAEMGDLGNFAFIFPKGEKKEDNWTQMWRMQMPECGGDYSGDCEGEKKL